MKQNQHEREFTPQGRINVVCNHPETFVNCRGRKICRHSADVGGRPNVCLEQSSPLIEGTPQRRGSPWLTDHRTCATEIPQSEQP